MLAHVPAKVPVRIVHVFEYDITDSRYILVVVQSSDVPGERRDLAPGSSLSRRREFPCDYYVLDLVVHVLQPKSSRDPGAPRTQYWNSLPFCMQSLAAGAE